MPHGQELGHGREPRAERRARIQLVLEAAHDVVDVRVRPARAYRHLRAPAVQRAQRAVPPLVRGPTQLPRALTAGGVRGDARCPLRAEPVLLVLLDERGAELVRKGRAEEGVQFEARLLDESGGERFHRAGLEVDRVEELREEGDVFVRERVVWQRWVGGFGVRLEVSLS